MKPRKSATLRTKHCRLLRKEAASKDLHKRDICRFLRNRWFTTNGLQLFNIKTRWIALLKDTRKNEICLSNKNTEMTSIIRGRTSPANKERTKKPTSKLDSMF